jgi:hypothetical protein
VFPNIKWLRLTPDRPGRGGTNTGNHSFQQTPINDVRVLTNAHIYRGAWRRDYDPVEYPGEVVEAGTFGCLAIHGYTFPSLTDPSAAPTIKIFEQNILGGGQSAVYCTDGNVRQLRPGTNQPGSFVNIGGRCVFGEGATEALVMDDRTPAIHAQPNQPLGIDAPKQPLQLKSGISYSPLGLAYSFCGNKFINSPNPNHPLSTIVASDTVSTSFPNAGINAGAVASGAVTVAGKTSNTATFTNTGTISITTGTSLVTLAGATWPADGEYCGLAINFNGYSFVIAETTINPAVAVPSNYDINGNVQVLSNVQLLIRGVYDGPTITGIPYTITGSQVKLTSNSTATSSNFGVLGYGQLTQSNLIAAVIFVTRSNGFYRNMGNISLGPAGGGVPDTVTDMTIGNGFNQAYSPSGPWVSTDIGKTAVLDHCGDAAGNTMLVSTITSVSGTAYIGLASPNMNAAPVVNKRVWWVSNPTGVSDATMAGGTAVVTSASNPWTVNDVGKEIIVAKAGAGGAPADALFGTIITFTNAGSITISVNCNGGGVAGVQAYWGGAVSNTHAGPTYAYAWYDPETGHMSNISPLFTVPKPTIQGSYPDFANLSMFFSVDPGQIAYPGATDAVRFSHIMFFRTLSTPGSSTLYPIGSLNPYVGKVHPGGASTRGSWNPGALSGWMGLPNSWALPGIVTAQDWYDFSSDSDLLLSGGFRAPQFTNGKPMALLRGGATQPGYPYLMAYWDRRLWIVNAQEPSKVMFSCDEAQCPLGVPEESFPQQNFLRLPSAADGKAIGMKAVGDMLIITTQRFAYIVAGNNESNYRLMKISSSMPGVGTYQMSEFPTATGAEGEPTTLFFLGRDRIVYQWTIGRSVIPISTPIQDQLDSALTNQPALTFYQGSRVHCVSAWGRRLVIVAPYYSIAQAGGLTTYIYDIDAQVWSKAYRGDGVVGGGSLFGGTAPMTTVYGAGSVPVNELYAISTNNSVAGVHAMSWIRDDGTTCTFPMRVESFPMALDGKKTRKQLTSVNIHASAGTWTGQVYVNDQASASFTFAPYPDPITSIYAPTGVQGVPDDVPAQDLVCMAGQFLTDGTPLVGYRFTIVVTKDADSNPAQLYAVDVGYIDVEAPGDGDA